MSRFPFTILLLLSAAFAGAAGGNPAKGDPKRFEEAYARNVEQITAGLPGRAKNEVNDVLVQLPEGLAPYVAEFVRSAGAAGNVKFNKGEFIQQFGPIIRELEGGRGDDLRELLHSFHEIRGIVREASGAGGIDSGLTRVPVSDKWLGAQARAHPKDPVISMYDGWSLFDAENFAAARPKLDQAISGGMAQPQVYYMRGVSNYNTGRLGEAHADAREVLKRQPDNLKAQSLFKLTRGHVPGEKPRVRRARFGARGVVAAASSGGGAGGAGPETAPSGNMPAVIAADSVAPRRSAQSAQLTKEAITAIRVRDYSGAVSKASKAIELDSGNARAYQVRAAAHVNRKDYAAAVRDSSHSLKLSPDYVAGLNTRALAYNRSRRYAQGLRDAAAAVELAPRGAMGYFNRAYSQAGLGKREAMLDDLRSAAEINPAFAPKLSRALQMTQNDDTLLLFDGVLAGGAIPAEGSPDEEPGGGRLLFMVFFSLVAGAAVAFFLSRFFGRGPGELLGEIVRRLRKPVKEEAVKSGTLAARYKYVRKIASGGMGIVYEAIDRTLVRRVAVKRMRDEFRSDKIERERFLSEARTVAKMRHQNLVGIHAVVEEGEDAYLVFEYVEGRTLDEILNEHKCLAVDQTRDIFRGVCAALEYAHNRGVIHRDLKPSNIMVDREGIIKVMDFGVARTAKDAINKMAVTNTVMGTPPYMAPEQEEGVVRPEIDIYALGICLYECLCGVRPFEGTPGVVTLKKMKGEYVPVTKVDAELPKSFDGVVDKALHPDPERRFKTPAEFFAALDGAVEGVAAREPSSGG